MYWSGIKKLSEGDMDKSKVQILKEKNDKIVTEEMIGVTTRELIEEHIRL